MIHPHVVDLARLRGLAIGDWWSIGASELERLAATLLSEPIEGPWVRRGAIFAIISNRKLGSLAAKLPVELVELSAETRKVLVGSHPDAVLRAAAAYHIRFQNIHPLVQGNGRVGRTILAAQIHQSLGVLPEELLGSLNAQEMDYVAAFVSDKPEMMFELLLDLLAQLTGSVIQPESSKVPFSVQPLYPDRRPLVEGGLKRRPPATPIRPSLKNNYFRRFG
jgi:hypothetical protein